MVDPSVVTYPLQDSLEIPFELENSMYAGQCKVDFTILYVRLLDIVCVYYCLKVHKLCKLLVLLQME